MPLTGPNAGKQKGPRILLPGWFAKDQLSAIFRGQNVPSSMFVIYMHTMDIPLIIDAQSMTSMTSSLSKGSRLSTISHARACFFVGTCSDSPPIRQRVAGTLNEVRL